MKPDYFIVPIKLCPEFGNDERIILCSFGDRIVSVFDVMEWSVGAPPPPQPPPCHRRAAIGLIITIVTANYQEKRSVSIQMKSKQKPYQI